MDRCLAPFHPLLRSALLICLIFTWGCAPGDAGSPVLRTDVIGAATDRQLALRYLLLKHRERPETVRYYADSRHIL